MQFGTGIRKRLKGCTSCEDLLQLYGMPNVPRTIIITGGIVSGIGKGITAASIGRLLINRGFSVAPVKADPYLNHDAGTMNPFQHGEVFVTDDGAETDLDLGHYERFLDINLNHNANFTSGAVYQSVMDQEREGSYLGKTIQIIPHVTDEIKRRIGLAGEHRPDFLTIEVGGTVGDIEALPFIESMQQYRNEHRTRTIVVHVVKMDYLYPSDEGKTKPIQHAVSLVRSYGLQPDILIVRCKRPMLPEEREKLAMFTGVPLHRIISAQDADSLYSIPSALDKNGLADAILELFPDAEAKVDETETQEWEKLLDNQRHCAGKIRVGLVGKYIELSDAYLSVIESIQHAGIFHRVKTELVPINAEAENLDELVESVDAIIVPGGFGNRGTEGKIRAIEIARTKNIPFLGICLGLQLAVIEYARSMAKLSNATSSEFDENAEQPVIAFLPGQEGLRRKGGTMRLGSYPAILEPGTLATKIYTTYRPEELIDQTIQERHRHRYEVNPKYHAALQKAGMRFSGMSPDGELVEFIELDQDVHPYFIATQAHPEFRSRPQRPHPLFAGLIAAAHLRK